MRIARTITEVERWPEGHGFVPTMGALHAGHRKLLEVAREECARVTLSIFVNPLQFGLDEDLSRYPRPIEADLAIAEAVGIDQVFLPGVEEMYPSSPTKIHVPAITDLWEGASRPGHFDGVATVVAKLFGIVGAQTAYFGRKDLQQCLVVRKMVRDLSLPISLVLVPTVREEDGLARSSRNVYLSPEERAVAPEIYATLTEIAARIRETGSNDALVAGEKRLADAGFEVDYLGYVDTRTLLPIPEYKPDSALIVAAKLGRTRLIDNIVLE
ncbi:pantoate--beta-alanine ligase [bacterium]|nr:MAG: pantoate--beta-alanine ligase [bacterium]